MSERPEDPRLRVLEATELLDSPADPAFDRLTRLAAHLLGAPVALVSLVDAARQFFKSAHGLGEPWATRRETPLSHSFCQHVVHDRAPFVVADAREHPRVRDNLAIPELGVVAYAGIPLVVQGQAIGALCAIDHRPHEWPPEKLRLLEDVAASVVSEIELRFALEAEHAARALTTAIVDGLGEACMALDADGRFIVVNQVARRMFPNAVLGQPIPDAWSKRHRSHRPDGTPFREREGALPSALRGEETDGLTFTMLRPETDEEFWVEATGRPIRSRDGAGNVSIIGAVGIYRDVTQKHREAEALRDARDSLVHEQTLLAATLAHIEDAVALLDADRRILLCNDPYTQMIGLPRERIIGMTRDEFFAHVGPLLEDPDRVRDQYNETPATQASMEIVFARPSRRIFRRDWTPLRLAQGDGYLVTWHDVTAERDLLREREQQALVDGLTGIPNRRAGEAALRTEHERHKRMGTPLCLAMFDIDHFKRVNDVHGHAKGDEVLKLVARALAGEARLTDTIARWGGEEFVAVVHVPLEGAIAFCERARGAVERLRVDGLDGVTISAGVAEVRAGETVADALARADARLYEAKAGGRNQVRG